MHAGPGGRRHILHRPVELYALAATWKRVDQSNQRSGYRLSSACIKKPLPGSSARGFCLD